ncbi:MAG: glycosyltransferase family 2 protein [Candidatus Methanomethylophilaceae archaeon]|nr:glycosyltransferase family 2 protein [Candidatus Methanomethylophilaceae archaeon]
MNSLHARREAIDVATGDYLMFVDSDDYLVPNACSIALNAAI